jgi:hypothetical protein
MTKGWELGDSRGAIDGTYWHFGPEYPSYSNAASSIEGRMVKIIEMRQ